MLRAIFLLVTFALLGGSLAMDLRGDWTKQKYQPSPRTDAAVACDDDDLYMHGGRDDYGNVLDELWRYNTIDDKWYQIFPGGTEPTKFDHGLAVVGDGYVYAMFGFYDDEVLDEVTVYNPEQDVWVTSRLDVRPVPRRQFATISGLVDGFYIMFGRASHELLNDVQYFNFTSKQWISLDNDSWVEGIDDPEPRVSTCCDTNDALDGFLCFGGSGSRQKFDDLWFFDIPKRKWTEILPDPKSPRPEARDMSMCGWKRGRFTILMGENDRFEELNDHWVFDYSTRFWTRLPNAPMTRLNGGGCLVGDKLIITSGETGESFTNDLYSLTFDTWKWERLRDNYMIPPAVAASGFARVGVQLYVIWGDSAAAPTSQVWTYNLQKDTWKLLNDFWEDGRSPVAKGGIAAVDKGTMIFVFGGYTEVARKREATNNLYALNVAENQITGEPLNMWTQVDIIGPSPPKRYNHAMCRVGELLFVFGGIGIDGKELGDFWMYTPVYNSWSEIKPNPKMAFPAPRYGTVLWSLPEGDLPLKNTPNAEDYRIVGYLALAGGSDGGEERWKIVVGQLIADERQAVAEFHLYPEKYPKGFKDVHFSRVNHVVAGANSLWLMCGGSTDEDFVGYNEQVECFMWNSNTSQTFNISAAELPANVMASAIIPYKNKVYIIGGYYLDSDVVRDNPTMVIQTLTVDNAQICRPETDESMCWECSDGTDFDEKLQMCVDVPAGQYIETPGEDPQKCQAGEYSTIVSATSADVCIPCPEGTYNPTPGSAKCLPCPPGKFCPVRSNVPQDNVVSGSDSKDDFDEVPKEYVPPRVPIEVYITFLASIVIVIGFVIIMYGLHLLCAYWFITKTMTRDDRITVKDTLYKYDPETQGVDGPKLFSVLTHLGVSDLSEEEAHEMVGANDVLEGNRLLHFPEVQMLCAVLVQEKRLRFPDTPETPPALSPFILWFAKFSFKSLDILDTKHSARNVPGEGVMVVQNNNGGIASMLYILVAVCFAILLIVTFDYENISETRSAIPAVVSGSEAYANLKLRVSTSGDSDKTNCVTNKDACIPGMEINAVGFKEGVGNVFKSDCEWVEPRFCVAHWECKNCTVSGFKAYVDVIFFESDWFSTLTAVQVTASSGVPEDVPSICGRSARPDNGTIFLGFPTTKFVVEVTPTLTTSPVSSWDHTMTFKTGYHTRFLDSQFERGNLVDPSELPHVYRVPVRIEFTETQGALMIDRMAKSSVVTLVSTVIGGCSGLIGIFVFITLILDTLTIKYRSLLQSKIKESVLIERERKASMCYEVNESFSKPSDSQSPGGLAKVDDFKEQIKEEGKGKGGN